jgi:hypothetical protein
LFDIRRRIWRNPCAWNSVNVVDSPMTLSITVKGDCGKVHSSFEDWQSCEACRRIGVYQEFEQRVKAYFDSDPNEPAARLILDLLRALRKAK